MEWSNEDIARQRPVLQALASSKYDEYQQFSPGMRFVESLALWLQQLCRVRFADHSSRDRRVRERSGELGGRAPRRAPM